MAELTAKPKLSDTYSDGTRVYPPTKLGRRAFAKDTRMWEGQQAQLRAFRQKPITTGDVARA